MINTTPDNGCQNPSIESIDTMIFVDKPQFGTLLSVLIMKQGGCKQNYLNKKYCIIWSFFLKKKKLPIPLKNNSRCTHGNLYNNSNLINIIDSNYTFL